MALWGRNSWNSWASADLCRTVSSQTPWLHAEPKPGVCWELLPKASAHQWGHKERSVVALRKFFSGISQYYASYRSSLLGNWISFCVAFLTRLFLLSSHSAMWIGPNEFYPIFALPVLCKVYFFLFLPTRRNISVISHAHRNTGDESGWEQNMASKLYPQCSNHYTNCFSLAPSW